MSKLVKCKTCGAEMAKSASKCPSCGAKRKRPVLGTILIIICILIVVAAFSGSSDEPEKVGDIGSNQQQGTTNNSQAPEKTEFTVGDKVELNSIVVTLVDISESTGSQFMGPAEGNIFVICEFEIENNSTKDIAVSSIMCFEAYVDDYATNMSISATASADKSQLDGTVAAGKKMNGVIGYEVPSDWSEIEIRFTPDFWSGKDIIFTYGK